MEIGDMGTGDAKVWVVMLIDGWLVHLHNNLCPCDKRLHPDKWQALYC